MPDVTAQDFVAGYLDGYFFDCEETERAEQAALDLLQAMAESGLVVVQLPKPGPLSDHHEDGTVVFYYGQDGEITVWDDGSHVPISDTEGHDFSIALAREHAGALLAAAEEIRHA